MINQIKIDGVWVDGEPTQEGQNYRKKIPVGDLFGYEYRRHTLIVQMPFMKVGMGKLGELLPDAVLVELEDFKNLTSTAMGKRKAAARVLTRINSNTPVDVLHADFTALISQLVTQTSLTQAEADSMLNTLQNN